MSHHGRPLLSCCVATVFAAAPVCALAQPARAPRAGAPDATVVAIDTGELVLDIGAAKGIREGDLVELWRPVRLRHPVTSQVLVDRFRIGTLRLSQVRGTLSLALVEGAASRPPAIGDVVLLPERPRELAHGGGSPPPHEAPVPGATSKPTPGSAALPSERTQTPHVDPDAQRLGELMVTLTGLDPASRANAYEAFVRAFPKSRFAAVLGEEVAALRALEAEQRPRDYEASLPELESVRAGEAQRFAVELDARFIGAVVHVRRKGAAGYRSVAMESIGPRYWAAALPGDAMTGDGMEYFVEGVPKVGAPVAIGGTAVTPREVEVEVLPGTPRPPGTLAQATMQTEYASFNAKRANDYVWQTEGSVGWRLHDEGIRAVRSGFGVLRGQGGSLKDLDDLGKDPERVGLTYGYLEAEITLTSTYALIGRPILGLREGGLTGGAQAFIRIGNDLRTNLSIGGEVLGTVGQRGIVQLDWRTLRRFPIVLRTEVTNQPASSRDIGARAIAQVGYELSTALVLAVRGSYQGRTINHAGPGAGLAVSYQW